jgi:hypothetical protein
MLQGPNRAPLILAITVILAFGAGLVAQGVTGDTSGKAMILTTMPIIGLGIIAMVQWQKGWFERSRAADREQRAATRQRRMRWTRSGTSSAASCATGASWSSPYAR